METGSSASRKDSVSHRANSNSLHLESSEWCGRWGARSHIRAKRGEEVNKSMILATALVLVSIWVVMAAGIAPVWLTEDVRAMALAILPTAAVATLLVLWFDWRAQLQRSILVEHR